MLIGFLLPMLRRLNARALMLFGILMLVAGLALVLTLAIRGHAPGGSVLLIRVGILLVLAGPVTFASGLRGAGRGRHIDSGDDADRPAEQPGDQA